jgi:glycerol-3-phosphate dehydrogenase (NAD(P)+)
MKTEAADDKIGVLGLGNWGTALANHFAVMGFDVLGWSIEADVVESINKDHRNCNYLNHVVLNERMRATSDLDKVCERPFLVLVLPSSVLGEVLPQAKISENTILVSGIKGINHQELLTPLQCADKYLPVKAQLAVVSGPSFAKDVVVQKPVGLVAAAEDRKVAAKVADFFTSEWVKVYTSEDPLGVELGGIIKNVIAIAAGVSDGLQLGDSARAGLVTRGLAEMMRLVHALGADVRTLSGLSGLGDLVLTATCDASRNRTVGLRLGRGESLEHIVKTLGSVAEGIKTAPLVMKLARRHGVEMPISEQVQRLLQGEISPEEMARLLISRPVKPELDRF